VNGLNYNVNNAWLRENGDNAHFRQYGNTRQMVFRTDGTTQYATGVGEYPFVWMYGGDASSNRRMFLNTSGQLWCSNYGWLHDKFMARTQVFSDTNSNASFTGQNIDFNSSGSQANTGNQTHRAFLIDYDSSASGGTDTSGQRNYHYAMHSDMRHGGTGNQYVFYNHYLYTRSDHTSGTCRYMRGIDNIIVSSGTGLNTEIWGINTYVLKDGGSTGATTNMYGIKSEVEVDAGTVTNAYSYHAHIDRDGGTLTNGYLYYGSYAGTVGTKWGLYLTGETKNYFSGSVGIGTTSPTETLDVNGSVRQRGANTYLDWAERRIIMNYDATYRQGIHFSTGNREMTLFSTTGDSGGSIIFKTRVGGGSSDTDYGIERMRITGGGLVGIGVTSPGSELDVNGTISATHVSLGTKLYPTLGGKWFTINSPTYDGDLGDQYPDPDGGILFTNQSSSGGFPWGYYMGVVKDVEGANGTTQRFDIGKSSDLNTSDYTTGADTLTPYLTIDNGNVGIGTTSPGYKLDVAGTLHAGNSYFDNVYIGGSTTRGLRAVSGTYGTVQTTGGGAGYWEGYSIDGRYVFMSKDNNNVGIYNDLDNEWMIYCARNAWTKLYYNGAEKLATTNTGVSVTGGIVMDGKTLNAVSGLNWNSGTSTLSVNGGITKTQYNRGEVIEELHSVCNSTSLHGRATIQNVTGYYAIPESYGDATGSVVTNYTPPTGTKTIVYEFACMLQWFDAHAISHWRLYFKLGSGSWVEVSKARYSRSGYYPEDKIITRWVFTYNASSADNSLGVITGTPVLSFKWMVRDYGGANERGGLHRTQYWDGGGTDMYSQPMIMIKAIA
jgi:hypothetical protein